MGHLYEDGRGVEQNDKEAVEWYRKAAEQGYAPAQFALGCLYEDGHGVEQNEGEAIKWYRKAAAQGYKEALLYLGHLHEEKRVELEYYEIIECYKMMAEKGDEYERE